MLWLIPFLLVCLFLLFRFVSPYTPPEAVRESFQDRTAPSAPLPLSNPSVSDTFRNAYERFLGFYKPFHERWRDALVRAWGIEQPVPENGGRKEPTEKDLAETVARLIQTQGKLFPSPVSHDGMPAPTGLQTLADVDRTQLMERIPSSSDPYRHAVEWMNEQMLRAEKELEKVLRGGGLPALEGFAGEGTCAELSQCFQELLMEQQEKAGNRLEQTEKELIGRMALFQQPGLVSAFELNGRLVKKAKETEAKAKSGDWIKEIQMGSSEPEQRGKMPPGGNALEELRRSHPERYKELQARNPGLFSVKQLLEQINQRV